MPQTHLPNPQSQALNAHHELKRSENIGRHNSNFGTARQIQRITNSLFKQYAEINLLPSDSVKFEELPGVGMATLRLPTPEGEIIDPSPYIHSKFKRPSKKRWGRHDHHYDMGSAEVFITDGIYDDKKRDIYGRSLSKDPQASVRIYKVNRDYRDVQGNKHTEEDIKAKLQTVYSQPKGHSRETVIENSEDTQQIRSIAVKQLRIARAQLATYRKR